jgi:hypothetical protein
MWADDPRWSTISHCMEFVAGDFFDAGESIIACLPAVMHMAGSLISLAAHGNGQIVLRPW